MSDAMSSSTRVRRRLYPAIRHFEPLDCLLCFLFVFSLPNVVAASFQHRHVERMARKALGTPEKPASWGRQSRKQWLHLSTENGMTTSSSEASVPTASRRKGNSSSSKSLKFKNFDDMLDSLDAKEPVLIAFGAANCGPCKLQKQELAAFQKQQQTTSSGPIRMLSIDTDKWPQIGSRFDLTKLPCLVVVKNKQVIARLDGLVRADELAEVMLPIISRASTT